MIAILFTLGTTYCLSFRMGNDMSNISENVQRSISNKYDIITGDSDSYSFPSHKASAGHCRLWHIYDCTKKIITDETAVQEEGVGVSVAEEFSVWVFNKANVGKRLSKKHSRPTRRGTIGAGTSGMTNTHEDGEAVEVEKQIFQIMLKDAKTAKSMSHKGVIRIVEVSEVV